MYEVTIRAQTAAELERQVIDLAKSFGGRTPEAASAAPAGNGDADGLRRALKEIHGRDAKKFYLDVAEAVLRGESLLLDQALLDSYHKDSGRAFSGVQAGAYRVIDRIIHRRVIITDPDRGGYSMSADDARVVVEVYGKKS
jgi:hypothetical protein